MEEDSITSPDGEMVDHCSQFLERLCDSKLYIFVFQRFREKTFTRREFKIWIVRSFLHQEAFVVASWENFKNREKGVDL